jgi:hypothetical protein
VTTSTDGSTDYYSSLANYFSNSSGTTSQGKAGGAGGSKQQYAPPAQTSSSGGGSSGGSDNTQGGNAQSGANSWISAAVSQTSSDKSTFTTPFSQQFGGITNNQIINSAGAVGATTTSPIAPITADPSATGGGLGGVVSGFSPVTLVLAIFAGLALLFYVKR